LQQPITVFCQLIAQQAQVYARMGNRTEMEKALECGRISLEGMEYPSNIDNHFVVDQSKYDFYVMDC
jgi:hypothetical protein